MTTSDWSTEPGSAEFEKRNDCSNNLPCPSASQRPADRRDCVAATLRNAPSGGLSDQRRNWPGCAPVRRRRSTCRNPDRPSMPTTTPTPPTPNNLVCHPVEDLRASRGHDGAGVAIEAGRHDASLHARAPCMTPGPTRKPGPSVLGHPRTCPRRRVNFRAVLGLPRRHLRRLCAPTRPHSAMSLATRFVE